MSSRPCPKSGIKIRETNNNVQYTNSKLSKPVSFQNTTLSSLDLDLEHYSLDDLYHLFGISFLNEDTLKTAKQITLKMHPDKSQLDSKYFLFFSKAYKRLYGVYEFQNKSTTNKKYKDEDFFDDSNRNILNNMFENNKEFKDSKNFNSWFNNAFEKHRLENPLETGHGDWLKSNEGFIDVNENITKTNMNDVFEQKKKQMQAVTVYTGVTDMFSSTFGGSLLDGSDAGSNNYMDLREAYTQTLIPVTNEDYEKVKKFNSVSEYKAHRERVDTTPLSKQEAERKLHQQQQEYDRHSAALAYKYAKEAEKAKEKQNGFWADIKQISGW